MSHARIASASLTRPPLWRNNTRMDFGNDLLPWIFGIGIALALLGRSGRRRRRRQRRRKASPSNARGQRRDDSARFPREAVPGRVVRITDGDGVLADVVSVGRVNVRLAYVDAPEHDQPWGPQSKKVLAQLVRGRELRFRLLYRDRYARAVAVVSTADYGGQRRARAPRPRVGVLAICAEAAARPIRGPRARSSGRKERTVGHGDATRGALGLEKARAERPACVAREDTAAAHPG